MKHSPAQTLEKFMHKIAIEAQKVHQDIDTEEALVDRFYSGTQINKQLILKISKEGDKFNPFEQLGVENFFEVAPGESLADRIKVICRRMIELEVRYKQTPSKEFYKLISYINGFKRYVRINLDTGFKMHIENVLKINGYDKPRICSLPVFSDRLKLEKTFKFNMSKNEEKQIYRESDCQDSQGTRSRCKNLRSMPHARHKRSDILQLA